ncbi:MAG TPA: 6-bladed beta-propeller [Planctomycetaceae bacterium]|nr:6-bladed beta-propeller [Planctomycetaceae bacterium]
MTVCVRPEQLTIEATPAAPLTVIHHRSAGIFDAIALSRDAAHPPREFLTTPAKQRFAPGTRVALRLLWSLLVAVFFSGCQDAEHNVPPTVEKTFSLPAEGTKVPAPRGVTVGPGGEIYVLDNIGRVLVMDRDGVTKKSWWMPEYSVGKPERLLVCRNGRLAVADTHYHRVVIFDTDGNVLLMFGRRGSGPGEFEYPVAIAEDDHDNLYVCEYGGNDRVQIFRPDGTYVSAFGSFGAGPGQFQRPSGIVWRDGRLYIVDAFNNRVHVCDETGAAVPLPPGAFSADLHYPYDVSLTENGIVYVVEYGAGRVTWFSRDGELLGRTGSTGPGSSQLATPWGLSVDGEHAVFIADTGNRRLVNWTLRK